MLSITAWNLYSVTAAFQFILFLKYFCNILEVEIFGIVRFLNT